MLTSCLPENVRLIDWSLHQRRPDVLGTSLIGCPYACGLGRRVTTSAKGIAWPLDLCSVEKHRPGDAVKVYRRFCLPSVILADPRELALDGEGVALSSPSLHWCQARDKQRVNENPALVWLLTGLWSHFSRINLEQFQWLWCEQDQTVKLG